MTEERGIRLTSKIEVNRLISDFYYELPRDFDYSGEKHAGWEFVYVESGKVCVGVEGASYILKKGEMVCHKPYEFHRLKPYEGKAGVVIICISVDLVLNTESSIRPSSISLLMNFRASRYSSVVKGAYSWPSSSMLKFLRSLK